MSDAPLITLIFNVTASSSSTSWEMITAIGTVLIALLALATSIWQAHTQRIHNRMSCRPHVTSWLHTGPSEGKMNFTVLNNGIGPAIIKSFRVFVDGEAIEGTPEIAIRTYIDNVLPALAHEEETGHLDPGYVLAVGEERTVLRIKYHDPTNPSLERIGGIVQRTKIIIEYESLYGDPFTSYEDSIAK